jgi:hypothetical protein
MSAPARTRANPFQQASASRYADLLGFNPLSEFGSDGYIHKYGLHTPERHQMLAEYLRYNPTHAKAVNGCLIEQENVSFFDPAYRTLVMNNPSGWRTDETMEEYLKRMRLAAAATGGLRTDDTMEEHLKRMRLTAAATGASFDRSSAAAAAGSTAAAAAAVGSKRPASAAASAAADNSERAATRPRHLTPEGAARIAQFDRMPLVEHALRLRDEYTTEEVTATKNVHKELRRRFGMGFPRFVIKPRKLADLTANGEALANALEALVTSAIDSYDWRYDSGMTYLYSKQFGQLELLLRAFRNVARNVDYAGYLGDSTHQATVDDQKRMWAAEDAGLHQLY